MNLILLLVNGTLIAGIYACAKIAAESGVSALGMVAWQLLFAALALSAVAALMGRLPVLSRVTVRYAAIAGTLGISAPNLITFASLAHVPAGLIGVIGALSPVFTYAIALAIGFERAQRLRALGIALGLAGVLSLLLPRSALPDASALPWALLALGGPLLLAGGNLFRSLAWPPGLHPLSAATLMLLTQAVLLVPVSLWLGQLPLPNVSSQSWAGADGALLGAGLLTTTLYLSAFELQRRAGPVVVGQLGYVITVASLLLGMFVFGERHGAAALAAIALVFAGVMLVQRAAPAAVPPRAGRVLEGAP
jgi:drug/metabolite transporter (DMT)-like permease